MAVDKLFCAAPISASELLGRAKERRAMGDEANAAGLYDEAKRHWALAEAYINEAEALIAADHVLTHKVAA